MAPDGKEEEDMVAIDVPNETIGKDSETEDLEGNNHHEGTTNPTTSIKSSRPWLLLGLFGFAILVVTVALPTTLVVVLRNQEANTNDPATNNPGPFPSSLPLFGPEITDTYDNKEDVAHDLEQAAWFLVNQVIKRNTRVPGYESVAMGRPFFSVGCPNCGGDLVTGTPPVADASPGMPESGKGSSITGVSDSLTDYGTNNQETDVEEGDVVVSDGDYVYAAYGDYLMVWNATSGENVTSVKMPRPEDVASNAASTGNRKASSIISPYYSKPSIRSLLLNGTRLLVIVEGYGNALKEEAGKDATILESYKATHVRLYDTQSIVRGISDPISSSDLHGSFNSVRSINGKAHVMTMTGIDVYTDLVAPFDRWNLKKLADDDNAYIDYVNQTARSISVPNFVNKLLKVLEYDDGSLLNLVRICLWQKEESGTGLEELSFTEGILNNLAQVHSFDLGSNNAIMTPSVSGSFIPSYWAKFYASTDTIVIAGQGWNYNSTTGSSNEATYFLVFGANEAATSPRAVGMADGFVLNNHAMDVVNNVFRVGTTIRNSRMVRPVTEPVGGVTVGSTVFSEPPESSTENYIILLDLGTGNNSTMDELGRLKLGKPNEVFTALRFFDNIAYAVTYERRDPLYVLDLSNPRDPQEKAALDISGFSSYLHSMNADNSLLLAIGQDSTDDGTILGVQITVFDVTNPSKPFAAVRRVIEDDLGTYSYTPSLDDFKATRFAGDRLIIPMDIYPSWTDQGKQGKEFHGFITYFVNATHIEQECTIPHQTAKDSGSFETDECFYCAFLQPRSMIFDGNLMTMNHHFVRSNDMNTCKEEWSLDLLIKDDSGGCCNAYYY